MQTEPKKRPRRFYLILASTILIFVVIFGFVIFELTNTAQDQNSSQNNYGPGPVEIEVTTDKPFYMQGELINFTVYVNNPQDWPVPLPNQDSQEIVGSSNTVLDVSGFSTPPPDMVDTYPAHSRTLSSTYPWNQKTNIDGNLTQVPAGNYNFTIAFYGLVDYGEGGSCTFEIRMP